MSRHANIPIFIADRGCPHQCAFCNQKKITNTAEDVSVQQARELIEASLLTLKTNNVEIAYFGGSFSGIPQKDQEAFLSLAQEYVKEGRVSGIRLSTRPDLIDREVLDRLSHFRVTTVELGAQSMDDEVLSLNQRGHTAQQTVLAAQLVKEQGISLGLQMMVGLRGDSKKKAVASAHQIAKLRPDSTRIYPAVVLKGTLLEKWYCEGIYHPLSLDDAIDCCCELVPIFEESDVEILRMGLMASDSLLADGELVAGPFHSSFGELVKSELMLRQAKALLSKDHKIHSDITICVASRALSQMIGHKRKNIEQLKREFALEKLIVAADDRLTGRNMKIVDR